MSAPEEQKVPTRVGNYEVSRDAEGRPVKLQSDRKGDTYLARHALLDSPAALTLLDIDTIRDRAIEARFLHEESLLKSRPPQFPRLWECGVDKGVRYRAMELCTGGDLEQFLAGHRPLSQDQVLQIGLKVARALTYLHGQGFIHSDIKPANVVFVTNPDQGPADLVLVDFGQMLPIEGPRRVDSPRTLTPRFASPEQWLARDLDDRTDVYSLGLVLCHLLGYEKLFCGDTDEIIKRRLAEDRITPAFPDEWSPNLRRLLKHMLAVEPRRRPSAREVVAVIEKALAEMQPGRVIVAGEMEPSGQTTGGPTEAPPPEPPPPGDDPPPGGPGDSSSPHYPPENVQFTVFRPRALTRKEWKKMLVYTHLDDGPPGEPSPVEKVREEVTRLLTSSAKDYSEVTKDSRALIPREAEIQFVPKAEGVRFNPPCRSFFWTEGMDIHREEFEARAMESAAGAHLSGSITVYLGVLIVAELPLRFELADVETPSPAQDDLTAAQARPYRNIFPSYSRRDDRIVHQVEAYARTLGDRFLKDVTALRTGEEWSPRLLELIERADVFQLFWSSHSAQSKEVEREWKHALTQRRSQFVRPTFWEQPMPPPPPALSHLHFHRWEMPPQVDAPVHPFIRRPASIPAASPRPRPRRTGPETKVRHKVDVESPAPLAADYVESRPPPRQARNAWDDPRSSPPAAKSRRAMRAAIVAMALLATGIGTYSLRDHRDHSINHHDPELVFGQGPDMDALSWSPDPEERARLEAELADARRSLEASEASFLKISASREQGIGDFAYGLAMKHMVVAEIQIEMEDRSLFSVAADHLRQALELKDRFVAASPDPARWEDLAADAYVGLAQIAWTSGGIKDAQRFLRDSDAAESRGSKAPPPDRKKKEELQRRIHEALEGLAPPTSGTPPKTRD